MVYGKYCDPILIWVEEEGKGIQRLLDSLKIDVAAQFLQECIPPEDHKDFLLFYHW